MARHDDREERRPADEAGEDYESHEMGGDIGPASLRGPNVRPGGGAEGDAAPAGGRAEPTANVAGRDDEWPVTAGSADKEGAPRSDETEGRDLTVGSDATGAADREEGEVGSGEGPSDERE